jgi:putative lipoprotein
MKRYLPWLVILGLATACAEIATQSRTQVTGTATYKERMALPPNAILEVTLEDVSKAGALAEILGRTRIEQPGNPPFRFEITYDPSRIDPRHRYTVRARIVADGRLLFITDRHYSVLTAGSGNEAALLLRRVGGSSEGSNEPLENTHWKLVRLGDTAVNVTEKQREPHLIFHPASRRVGGSGGCNRLTGGYERVGDRVTFGQMAGTLMACPTGMDIEQKFLAALGQTTSVRITGQHLELIDAAGQVVADLEAVYVR